MSTSPQVGWQPGCAVLLGLNASDGAARALTTSSNRAAKKGILVAMVATMALDAHKLQIRSKLACHHMSRVPELKWAGETWSCWSSESHCFSFWKLAPQYIVPIRRGLLVQCLLFYYENKLLFRNDGPQIEITLVTRSNNGDNNASFNGIPGFHFVVSKTSCHLKYFETINETTPKIHVSF
jgi:hypothetical protein